MSLDPWIIEEIRKREEEKRRREQERQQPHLPVPELPQHPPQETEEPEEKRGPIEIDIGGNDDEDEPGSCGGRTFRIHLI